MTECSVSKNSLVLTGLILLVINNVQFISKIISVRKCFCFLAVYFFVALLL